MILWLAHVLLLAKTAGVRVFAHVSACGAFFAKQVSLDAGIPKSAFRRSGECRSLLFRQFSYKRRLAKTRHYYAWRASSDRQV